MTVGMGEQQQIPGRFQKIQVNLMIESMCMSTKKKRSSKLSLTLHLSKSRKRKASRILLLNLEPCFRSLDVCRQKVSPAYRKEVMKRC
jgi:hypothetical protein